MSESTSSASAPKPDRRVVYKQKRIHRDAYQHTGRQWPFTTETANVVISVTGGIRAERRKLLLDMKLLYRGQHYDINGITGGVAKTLVTPMQPIPEKLLQDGVGLNAFIEYCRNEIFFNPRIKPRSEVVEKWPNVLAESDPGPRVSVSKGFGVKR